MAIMLLIMTALVLWLQLRSGRRGRGTVEASLELTKRLVEPGERTELIVTVSNRTRALLPFLRLTVRLPRGAAAARPEKHRRLELIDRDEIVMSTWAAPMQRLRLRIPVYADKRGRYLFDRITLSQGDFLGLRERREDFYAFTELVVAPREAPEGGPRIPGSFPGDLSVRRFLLEDPVLTVGCREYTGREPMKSIAWTASARTGHLMVKQYDHTMDASVAVLVNVFTGAGEPEARAEGCFSLARSACRTLEDRCVKYSLYTDACGVDPLGPIRAVGEGLGPRHFGRVLELLGRSTCYGLGTFDKLLERASGQSGGLCGLLLITAAGDRDILAAARRCAARNGVDLVTLTPEVEAP